MTKKIEIHCDGGSRGNPGPAASAFTVNHESKIIHEESKYLGTTTNNVAEYTAVIMALTWLINQPDIEEARIVVDSELVEKQMKGEYKIKSPLLKPLALKAKSLETSLPFPILYTHVLRSSNTRADALVNEALDNPR